MPQIKGTAIRGLLKFVKSREYPGGVRGVLERMPGELRVPLGAQVLPSKWYPYATYGALLRVVDRELGRGDLSLMREVGVWAATQDSGTLLQVVMNMLSVERVLRMSGSFWSRICDTGTFATTELEKGRGVGQLSAFPDVAVEHCHLLAGWIEGMARAAGAKTVTMEKSKCVHRGDAVCEYRGGWTL